jgi:hypothetical protein
MFTILAFQAVRQEITEKVKAPKVGGIPFYQTTGKDPLIQ